MAPSQSATAAQLKEEGNALFVKKEFVAAHEKYTEAIAIDAQNAVLYANRSACSFGLNKYVDALRDAHKATDIDPSYAKGWSRRAATCEATQQWHDAVDSWQKALDALPKTNLSPAEMKQKEQYAASLEKAQQHIKTKPPTRQGFVVNPKEKMPWQAAEEMLPELAAIGRAGFTSSAYLVHYANKDFVEGVEYMKEIKEVDMKDPSGNLALVGRLGAITCISNGLLSDSRVLRVDSTDWMAKYNLQLRLECEQTEAWITEDSDNIRRLALDRLKKEGWDNVRPALAIVVRAWYMRAIFDRELRGVNSVAVQLLKDVIELLHWGRQVWKDVHKDDRGAIFEDTFVRGMKVAYLNCLMQAHAEATGADNKALLNTLFETANELREEMVKVANGPISREPNEPGFVSAFVVYPAAEAHAMLGYYHAHMGRFNASRKSDEKTHLLSAVEHYSQAAHMLPEDDEKHCWYLNCTINPSLHAGVSKKEIMGVVRAIRTVMPKMRRIWANSALAKQGRDGMIEATLRLAE